MTEITSNSFHLAVPTARFLASSNSQKPPSFNYWRSCQTKRAIAFPEVTQQICRLPLLTLSQYLRRYKRNPPDAVVCTNSPKTNIKLVFQGVLSRYPNDPSGRLFLVQTTSRAKHYSMVFPKLMAKENCQGSCHNGHQFNSCHHYVFRLVEEF